MKRMLLVISLITSIASRAQIEQTTIPKSFKIGEAKIFDKLIASLSFSIPASDTFYLLTFNNAKYTITDVHSVSFKETGGVLNILYNILSEVIEMKKGEYKSFKLGDEEIVATANRAMGIKFVDIMILKNGAYFSIRKKQLDSLFNKK